MSWWYAICARELEMQSEERSETVLDEFGRARRSSTSGSASS